MMTNCPTCGKPVDTIRARAVSVRDGKVVAFCSNECKAAAETQPVVVPRATPLAAPAKPAPATPSAAPNRTMTTEETGPVIEIVHEPASGVVTSAPDRRDVSAPAQTASASTAGSTTILDSKDEARAKAETKAKASKKQGKGKGTDTAPATTSASSPGKSKPDATVAGKPAATDANPGAQDVSALAPAPRALVAKAPETPVSGFRLKEFSTYEPLADAVEIQDSDARPPRRGRGVLVAIVLVVLGGGAVAAYKLLYANRAAATATAKPRGATASGSDGSAAATQSGGRVGSGGSNAELPAATPALTSAHAVELATAFLQNQLATGTPRLQGQAAMALARTQDPKAIEILATVMKAESVTTAKLDFAYALAKAGDKRGFEALARGLAGDRESKLWAGRRLVQLGDSRGVATLEDYLSVSQFTLGTAIVLAANKDPKGVDRAIAVLEKVRADAKAIPDDKARAICALGMAGHADVAAELVALLPDTRFNLDAAEALANLHDPAARPTLVKLLAVSGLRVRAARALRALEPELDALPFLPELVTVTESTNVDQGASEAIQVPAAETILVLAGPVAWAKHE